MFGNPLLFDVIGCMSLQHAPYQSYATKKLQPFWSTDEGFEL